MTITKVLNFWFGSPDSPSYGQSHKEWFIKNSVFDGELRSRFLELYQQATRQELKVWENTPEGCLALLILLDQVPRNIFRNQPQAFATDKQARAIAHRVIEREWDRQLLPVQRWFVYLPFEHSEDLADQNLAVQLFRQLPNNGENQNTLDYALKHRDIIARFQRFPHRNAILGRESTEAEKDFLQQPDSSF
ncbi:MAG: DUF924 family protein [Jaaginema sp. PMC 1079.18]|nr:DUF924 family protein [Jaaginema sp. PMC 1080.18]MEC4850570.1 DUF924 family protein [Jaaginema sp. PMC 1079.18]MEC4866693.1 DUF924 family protein [Jaaginema sp. PMC 1078.18]